VRLLFDKGKQRRKRVEIKYAILLSAMTLQGKTNLMYATRLNYRMLQEILKELVASDLLSEERGGYITTKRGQALCKAFAHYRETLDLLMEQEKALKEFVPRPVVRAEESQQSLVGQSGRRFGD
jgi:predicted transcriptional regulator